MGGSVRRQGLHLREEFQPSRDRRRRRRGTAAAERGANDVQVLREREKVLPGVVGDAGVEEQARSDCKDLQHDCALQGRDLF